METSNKYRIDEWVEDVVYKFFEEAQTKGKLNFAELAAMAPLIQMYQTIQLKNVCDEIHILGSLLADGETGIYIKTTFDGIDVRVKEMPQDGPLSPKKGR